MIEIRRILCPIDFSEPSRQALDHAAALAVRYRSTITVLNVCAPVPATLAAPGMPLLSAPVPSPADLNARLDSMKRFVETEIVTPAQMQFEIGEGDAASEILDRAQAISSDLIVMGTHGRSGLDRLILGSVTEKVIRRAPCPVLTVRRPMNDVVPAPERLFHRVLCAVDFSDASLHALEYAFSLAPEADAHVTIVHVVEVSPAPPSEEAGVTEARALDAYVTAAAEARARQLQRIVPDSVRARCTVEAIVAVGKAHREIMRIASERHSDVIALGAHGFSIPQLLFGSTAHQVVRQARCPVLTVR
jgi:nucleotide-binding universal stress UspA family protein